jgi:tetratricopeptide (TPR) repeat protein
MSPEQVQGERATAASDVFALGAVFYEVLTGRRAFDADSLHAILSCVLADDPPPVRSFRPAVAPAVEDVVHRALRKDPHQRFADAGEMRKALHAAAPELVSRGSSGRLPRLSGIFPAAPPTADEAPTVSAPVVPEIAQAVVRSASRRRRARAALIVTAVAGPMAAVLWIVLLLRPALSPEAPSAPARAAAGASRGSEQMLREQLLDSMVQLARVSLDNKDYDGALRKAEEALTQDPQSEPARTILESARAALADRETTAREAREALSRKDLPGASAALSRLLTIDARHPAVRELSAALNTTFREEADKARQGSTQARAQAVARQAQALPDFGRADALVREGDGLVARGEHAVAAQRFAEARDVFARAAHAADVEKAARQEAEARRAAAEKAGRELRAGLSASAGPPAPGSSAGSGTGAAPTVDAELRRVLQDYGRAIETKDVALFRTVKPNLTSAEEKRLDQAFKVVKSQVVGMTVGPIEVTGSRAVAQVQRNDVVDGRPISYHQTIRFVQLPEGWKIESIGQ